MKTVTIKKGVLILLSILCIFSRCTDKQAEVAPKRVELSTTEKDRVIEKSRQFNEMLKRKETTDLVRSVINGGDKAALMKNYISANFQGKEQEAAMTINDHLFPEINKNVRTQTDEGEFFNTSPTVDLLTQQLSDKIKNTINSFNGDEGQMEDKMTSTLKTVIDDFKAEVQISETLTTDEVKALLAFAEFQNNSISSVIGFAVSIAREVNTSGGRTQLSLKNLVKIVVVVAVTVVVAAVVVCATAVTGGALVAAMGVYIAASTWGTIAAVGAIVGGVYGMAVGVDKAANRNQCPTDFNPKNVKGAFLNWDVCPV